MHPPLNASGRACAMNISRLQVLGVSLCSAGAFIYIMSELIGGEPDFRKIALIAGMLPVAVYAARRRRIGRKTA